MQADREQGKTVTEGEKEQPDQEQKTVTEDEKEHPDQEQRADTEDEKVLPDQEQGRTVTAEKEPQPVPQTATSTHTQVQSPPQEQKRTWNPVFVTNIPKEDIMKAYKQQFHESQTTQYDPKVRFVCKQGNTGEHSTIELSFKNKESFDKFNKSLKTLNPESELKQTIDKPKIGQQRPTIQPGRP